jgi:hypothetical protein
VRQLAAQQCRVVDKVLALSYQILVSTTTWQKVCLQNKWKTTQYNHNTTQVKLEGYYHHHSRRRDLYQK